MAVFAVGKPIVTNAEFNVYVEELLNRGISIVNRPRIPEPRTSRRWITVWRTSAEAEEFAEAMRKRTNDGSWTVHQFDDRAVIEQNVDGLVIHCIRDAMGAIYRLDRTSRLLIATAIPSANTWPEVFMGYETHFDAQRQFGEVIWGQIVIYLTGLTDSQIAQLGGVRIIDSSTKAVLFDSAADE